MTVSMILYGVAGILAIYIVVSIAVNNRFTTADAIASLGIVVSIILAIVLPSTSTPISSEWVIRKDYTSNGILLERNSDTGYTYNVLDSNILINGPFRLYVQFQNGIGLNNAILLIGHEALEGGEWWQGETRFEVGLDNDGSHVFFNIRDGNQLEPFVIEGFQKPEDRIVIIDFESRGQQISILNS